jgi:hypothetical protein
MQKLPSVGKFHFEPPISLDHLVGVREERRWHSNAKCIGGFHIDDQLETSWLLDRQIGGLGAFEDFVDIHGSLAKRSAYIAEYDISPPSSANQRGTETAGTRCCSASSAARLLGRLG